MRTLPHTPALLAVAARVVWFKTPDEAIEEPVHFLAHVMTYGTIDDLRVVSAYISPDDFREVLERAPAGVFDARSWAYWNLMFGRGGVGMPVRRLS